MSRALILTGLAILIVGLLWPLIARLGLGRLPGDIVVERGNWKFYFPIATSLLISLVVTLILRFLLRR